MKTIGILVVAVAVVGALLMADMPGASGEPAVLFQDDFNDGDDVGWSVVEGTWTVVDGVYVGPDPGGWNLVARSIAGEDWWGDYTFEGRFMIEPGAHEATLLFRVQWVLPGISHGEFYQIVNGLGGLTLHEIYGVQGGGNAIYLEFVPLSLDENTWYSFRIVLNGPSMEYYIDGNLVMSYDGLTSYSTGKIGLKTAHYGEAYFDDILVYSGPPSPTPTATATPTPTPTPMPGVGGMVEIQVRGSDSAVGSVADAPGASSRRNYVAIAALAAPAVVILIVGASYARRRRVR
jgi:hypothetical protein